MGQNEAKKYFAQLEEDQVYHIYNRGNNGTTLFSSDRNKDFFLQRMRRYILPYADILAWVLMGNHFHLLIRVKRVDDTFLASVRQEETVHAGRFLEDHQLHVFLIDQFKRWFNSYSKAYNKEQKRTGSLFEKRFRRIHVSNTAYARRCIHYIHHNPVHHGFVAHPSDWRYSSYGSVLSSGRTRMDREGVLAFFDGDRGYFRAYHEEVVEYLGIEEREGDV